MAKRRSKRWQEFSKSVRLERGNKCEGCMWTADETDLHCHHILDRLKYPQFEYDRGNVLVLCHVCHQNEPVSYGAFDESVKSKIVAYVQQHAPDRKDILNAVWRLSPQETQRPPPTKCLSRGRRKKAWRNSNYANLMSRGRL